MMYEAIKSQSNNESGNSIIKLSKENENINAEKRA